MKSFVLGYSDPDDGGICILAVVSRPTRAEALQSIGSRDDPSEGVIDAITSPTQGVSEGVRSACADAEWNDYSILLVEVETVA